MRGRKRVTIVWEMADRQLTAADIDHIETILATIIAKAIIEKNSTALLPHSADCSDCELGKEGTQ